MRSFSCAWLLAPAIFLSSCRQPLEEPVDRPPVASSKPKPRTDILTVGDTIEVFVMEDPSFNGSYKIRERGDIILPRLGRVIVAGVTIDDAQRKIQSSLQSSQLQVATVIADRTTATGLSNFNEAKKLLVFITGKVNKPGQHLVAVTTGDTVYAYEAVLIAGGVTQFADEKRAYILRRGGRGNREKLPLDLRSIRQGLKNDVALAEGDLICVPERRFAL